jgi:hypothetical protein
MIPPACAREDEVDKRTLGIILTIVTVLFCGCPGLIICLAGGLTAAGLGRYNVSLGELTGVGQGSVPSSYGYGMLCLGIVFVAIPIIIGIVMLRKPKAIPPADVVPPAS